MIAPLQVSRGFKLLPRTSGCSERGERLTCANTPRTRSDLPGCRLLALSGVDPFGVSCGLSADSQASTGAPLG